VPASRQSNAHLLTRKSEFGCRILAISNAFNFVIFMVCKSSRARHGLTSIEQLAARGDKIRLSYGFINEMTPALSAILSSRMIFNSREAGTGIHEVTEEWRSRIERTTRDMRFHIPTTVHEGTGSAEVQEDLESWNGDDEVDSSTPEDVSA